MWKDKSSSRAAALLEEDSILVTSSDENTVREVLKAMDRGEGFTDDESSIGRAMQAAGEGIISTALGNCWASTQHLDLTNITTELPGCEAVVVTITSGDEDTSQVTMVVVFKSERRAETGTEDLKANLEDNDKADIVVDDAQIKEDLVIMKLTIHE